MSDEMKVKQKQQRLPVGVREQIIPELGTMTDAALAKKYSRRGLNIARHTIFYMRKSNGIPAFEQRNYTAPDFRGRLEDAHPEVKELLGKVPVVVLAKRFNVARSCVRAAAQRLGLPTRAENFDAAFKEAEAKTAEA
ncbi:MAG: hypothetical protein WC322_06360 [Candidatus Paceibacterota bacterium]|jgi:hypothetical protein